MSCKLFVKFIIIAIVICIAGLAVAHPALSKTFSGLVVGITDGDTIQVMHFGKAEKIRLHGIDCPESHQAFGKRAKTFASDLAYNQTVTVEVQAIDKYGRTVGEVILPDGHSLNRELVKAGLAWWYRKYSNDQSLGELEAEARAAKRGLWSDQNPIPPWDFRKGNFSKDTSRTSEESLSEKLDPRDSVENTTSGHPPESLSERLIDIDLINSSAPTTDSLSERIRFEPTSKNPSGNPQSERLTLPAP